MSSAARQVLAAFDSLPDNDREGLITELLIRCPIGAGALPDAALVEMGDELFRAYDAAEADDAAAAD